MGQEWISAERGRPGRKLRARWHGRSGRAAIDGGQVERVPPLSPRSCARESLQSPWSFAARPEASWPARKAFHHRKMAEVRVRPDERRLPEAVSVRNLVVDFGREAPGAPRWPSNASGKPSPPTGGASSSTRWQSAPPEPPSGPHLAPIRARTCAPSWAEYAPRPPREPPRSAPRRAGRAPRGAPRPAPTRAPRHPPWWG
jgi:hypothetical protein